MFLNFFYFFRYHGCECIKVKPEDEKKKLLLKTRREKTSEKHRLLTSSNEIKLVTMKECEFRDLVETDPDLREFHDQWDPTFDVPRGKKLSQQDVKDAVTSGKLFGVGVISVKVPVSWEGSGFVHPLSPQEFFEVFPPVFQCRDVPFSKIGPYMQTCIKEKQLVDKAAAVTRTHIRRCETEGQPLDRGKLARAIREIEFREPPPQKLLVSLMGTERLVVTSPLMSWYWTHGLTVYVEEFIQYKPVPCFRPFAQMVTEARQTGNSVQARGMKILGNSGE